MLPRKNFEFLIMGSQLHHRIDSEAAEPLGDKLNPRKLIASQMGLTVIALCVVSAAPTRIVLLAGLAATGLLAVVTQTIVAFAANLASPAERGRVVGMITSGVVMGILLARTFAGLLTDLVGWRAVYLVSAALLLLIVGACLWLVPNVKREQTSLSYGMLIRSVLQLFVQVRLLRTRAVLAMLIFTAFSTLWSSLVLPLSEPRFSLSHSAIGAFGLAGVAGALAAARAGRLADRGLGQRTTVSLLSSYC